MPLFIQTSRQAIYRVIKVQDTLPPRPITIFENKIVQAAPIIVASMAKASTLMAGHFPPPEVIQGDSDHIVGIFLRNLPNAPLDSSSLKFPCFSNVY